MSTSPAAFLISWMIFDLPWMCTYSGKKPFSTSTPIFDFGRSTTWPTDAFTVKPEPRYFLIVFAFAGDSTTTSARSLPGRRFSGLAGASPSWSALDLALALAFAAGFFAGTAFFAAGLAAGFVFASGAALSFFVADIVTYSFVSAAPGSAR